jgi:hypothetical protein
MNVLDNVMIGMTAAKTVTDCRDNSRSFRDEHAAGLCHADDDPAYGNGTWIRHRLASARGLVSVGMEGAWYSRTATCAGVCALAGGA